MSEPYYSKTPQEALAEQQAAAAGLTDQEVDGGIRVSFCSGSGDEDLDALLEGLREAGKTLMRAYR